MSKIKAKLFYLTNKVENRFFKKRFYKFEFDKTFNIKYFLDGFDIPINSHIFIHAGLKNIKQLSGLEYKSIVDNIIKFLKEIYQPNAIIAPTFTPSFRKSGVYSKLYSKAEYGIFSELFRQVADYRSDDAIHSVGIVSDDIEKFKNLNYHDTFASDGFFGSFHKKTYILNINTEHFVSTYMHYVEELMNVPYKDKNRAIYKGVMYDENNEIIRIEQTNHFYKYSSSINRKKINNLLLDNNLIKYKFYKGISISCINVFELIEVLKKEIEKNPYYMVVF